MKYLLLALDLQEVFTLFACLVLFWTGLLQVLETRGSRGVRGFSRAGGSVTGLQERGKFGQKVTTRAGASCFLTPPRIPLTFQITLSILLIKALKINQAI